MAHIGQQISTYFTGALEEVRKVTWPTKKQTINYSIVVVAMSIGVAIFFGVLDKFFNYLLGLLI